MKAVDFFLSLIPLSLFFTSLVPISLKMFNKNREPKNITSSILTVCGIIISGVFLIFHPLNGEKTFFSNLVIFDGISFWGSFLVLLLVACTVFYSKNGNDVAKENFSEFLFLLLNASLGMILFVMSNDLLLSFISMEFLSLSLYLMISLGRNRTFSLEIALKYFILGSFASALFLFGVALIFGSLGTLQLNEILSAQVLSKPILILGLILVLSCLIFKISLFPFHAWSPEIYYGTQTSITAFVNSGVKVVFFLFLLRLFSLQGLFSESLFEIFTWLVVLSVIVGNVLACLQTEIKKMVIYSGIAHTGYLFIGLVAINDKGLVAESGIFYYLFTYVLMSLGAFGFISLLESKTQQTLSWENIKGLCFQHPFLALSSACIFLSFAGLPPFAGFWAKFFVFSAAWSSGLYWLAIWGIIGSLIGVYYYLKPVAYMFMQKEGMSFSTSYNYTYIAVGTLATLLLITGLVPGSVYKFIVDILSY